MNATPKTKLLAYREVEWTDEIDRLLGTESDSIIGHRLGISPKSIAARRRNLGQRFHRRKAEEIGHFSLITTTQSAWHNESRRFTLRIVRFFATHTILLDLRLAAQRGWSV